MNRLRLEITRSKYVSTRRSAIRQRERGQSLVEFALIMPVLILLLLGVVFFSMAFNLQMVLNAAAREGARAWASNRSNTSPCCASCASPCDPIAGGSPFEQNIVPLVRQYVTDNGYDGNNIIFRLVQVSNADTPAQEWANIRDSAEDATKVKLVIEYPYYLPTGGIQLEIVHLVAMASFKRGS